MTTPVLETVRLLLCQMDHADIDAVAAMLAHPEVMRFWPHPFRRDEAAAWIDRWISRYRTDGCGYWLAIDRVSGEAIGQIGILLQNLGGPQREAGLGYIVHHPFQRRGYATEGGEAAIQWAFRNLRCPRVVATIRPENLPSIAVAKKLGFAAGPVIEYFGFEHIVFSREAASSGSTLECN